VVARISAVTATLVLAVSGSALAAPSAYQAVLGAYERQGTVPACQFSVGELQAALRGVDTYGAQYFADFTQAIGAALSTRASGACSASASAPASSPVSASASGSASTSGSVSARAPSRTGGAPPGPPARFGSVTAATSAGVPAPLAVMGALAAALALFGAVVAVARLRGRE
jgi:hypothetical protein